MKYKVDDKYVTEKEFFGEKWEFDSLIDNPEFSYIGFFKGSWEGYMSFKKEILKLENPSENQYLRFQKDSSQYKLFIKMIEKHYPEVLL